MKIFNANFELCNKCKMCGFKKEDVIEYLNTVDSCASENIKYIPLNRILVTELCKPNYTMTLHEDFAVSLNNESSKQLIIDEGFKVLDDQYPNIILPKGTKIIFISKNVATFNFGEYLIKISGKESLGTFIIQFWGYIENESLKDFCIRLNVDPDEYLKRLKEYIKK